MFQMFRKKPSTIIKPIQGQLLDLDQVPDPMFSGKMLGDGFAIQPQAGQVYAPVTGTLHFISPQGHAYGIKAKDGAEIMIHVGIDSALLQGRGFQAQVQEGQEVQAGDLLLTFDLDLLQAGIPSPITPIILTNSDHYQLSALNYQAQLKEPVLDYQKK